MLARDKCYSSLQKYVNYGRKKFYTTGSWWQKLAPDLTHKGSDFTHAQLCFISGVSQVSEESDLKPILIRCQCHKHFMLVDYSPSKISNTVLCMHASMQHFQQSVAYFAMIVGYVCKMFINIYLRNLQP
jgi:hypothetical protein